MLPSPVSNLPWAMAASDIFAFEGHHYLVLVDYYSKYIEVTKLNDLTSQDTIEALKEHFSRHDVERSRSSSQNNKITLEEKQRQEQSTSGVQSHPKGSTSLRLNSPWDVG